MTRIEQLAGDIQQKRGRMGALLQAKKDRGGNFLPEELSEFTKLNGELTPITKEYETLSEVEKAARETEAFLAGQTPLGGHIPHGSGGGGGTGSGNGNGAGTKSLQIEGLGEIILKDETGKYLPDSQIKENIDRAARSNVSAMLAAMGGGFMSPEQSAERKAMVLADSFVKSPAFKDYSKSARRSPEVELQTKAILDTTAFPVTSVRSNLMLGLPTRRLVVADLMPNGSISQPRFLYVEETVATNGAAFVAEGGTKPESALQFAERSADVRKIATVLPVTDEMFEDAPLMRSYVQGRLVQFLQLAEENALLNASGVAPNLLGLLNNPNIGTLNKGADSIPDALYKATVKIEIDSQLSASGIIMNPLDWQTVRLSKDNQGQYLFGSPMAGDIERIFGYPVIKTVAMAQGTALPGAYDLAAQILRRSGIAFAVATEHADFFIKNQLMLRVEERLAFPVYRPQAFVEVNLLA